MTHYTTASLPTHQQDMRSIWKLPHGRYVLCLKGCTWQSSTAVNLTLDLSIHSIVRMMRCMLPAVRSSGLWEWICGWVSGFRPLNPIDGFILWVVSVFPPHNRFWISPGSEWDTKFRTWEDAKENILVNRIDQ